MSTSPTTIEHAFGWERRRFACGTYASSKQWRGVPVLKSNCLACRQAHLEREREDVKRLEGALAGARRYLLELEASVEDEVRDRYMKPRTEESTA